MSNVFSIKAQQAIINQTNFQTSQQFIAHWEGIFDSPIWVTEVRIEGVKRKPASLFFKGKQDPRQMLISNHLSKIDFSMYVDLTHDLNSPYIEIWNGLKAQSNNNGTLFPNWNLGVSGEQKNEPPPFEIYVLNPIYSDISDFSKTFSSSPFNNNVNFIWDYKFSLHFPKVSRMSNLSFNSQTSSQFLTCQISLVGTFLSVETQTQKKE